MPPRVMNGSQSKGPRLFKRDLPLAPGHDRAFALAFANNRRFPLADWRDHRRRGIGKSAASASVPFTLRPDDVFTTLVSITIRAKTIEHPTTKICFMGIPLVGRHSSQFSTSD